MPLVSATLMATFCSASASRRARITRLCTLSPSRPASGLSLTETVMAMVGGSIGWAGIGVVTSGSHRVSATVAFDSPAMATMSPASATSMAVRFRPRNASSLVTRPFSTMAPSRDSAWIAMPGVNLPASTRPVRIRPRNGSLSISTARNVAGSPARASALGAGTCSTILSNSGARVSDLLFMSSVAQPCLPLA